MAQRSHIINAFALTVFICLFGATTARSIPQINNEKAVEFLLYYGYVDGNGERTQLTDQEVEDAFNKFQEFYDLPQTGVLDDATEKLMEQERCGMSDIRTPRFVTQVTKWSRDIKWKLNYTIPGMSYSTARNAVMESIKEWTSRMNLGVTESTNINETKMIINFVYPDARGYHGGPTPFRNRTLAHAFYPGNGEIDGDVHVNMKFNFSFQEPPFATNYSAKQVLTHEIGHALGLGHTNISTAVMYAYASSGVPYKGLHEDDVLGIQELYGSKPTVQINGGTPATNLHLMTIAASFMLTFLLY